MRFLFISVLCMLVLMAIIHSRDAVREPSVPANHETFAGPVRASDLAVQYAANEINADLQYKGRKGQVVGRITSFGVSLIGESSLRRS